MQLWEYFEEIENSCKVKVGYFIVIPSWIFLPLLYIHIWKSNLSWWLNINCMSSFIPWLRIVNKRSKRIIEYKWSMFIQCSKQWWTARPSVKPEEKWIFICLIRLRREVKIMHVRSVVFEWYIKIARIPVFIVYACNLWNVDWFWSGWTKCQGDEQRNQDDIFHHKDIISIIKK